MKHLDVVQGTIPWIAARLGKPTASGYDRIVTAVKMQPSSAQDAYLDQLLAEWLLGHPVDDEGTDLTQRGTELETQARAYYELVTGWDVQLSGFCLTDDEHTGCSLDGTVGDGGILEIKCPGARHHMRYLRGVAQKEHRPQIQGQLWITGRQWVDLLSFHPALPPNIVRFERDEAFVAALAVEVPKFCRWLAEEKDKLVAKGYAPPEGGLAPWLREAVVG